MKITRQHGKLIIELEGDQDVAITGTKMDKQGKQVRVAWQIYHAEDLPEYDQLTAAEHTPELILMAFYAALRNAEFVKFLLNTFGGIDPRKISDYSSDEVPDKLN